MDVLYERYWMSQLYRVDNFHFEVTDDHLSHHQRVWVHYQNACTLFITIIAMKTLKMMQQD